MIRSLTAVQLSILRRSRHCLRVWEEGCDLAALLAELRILAQLGLVEHDEAFGYRTTPQGDACLVRLEA